MQHSKFISWIHLPQLFIYITLSLISVRCSKSISPKFETQVYMPLVRGTYSLLDFIYAFAPGSLYIDPIDSNVTFFYLKDTVLDFIQPSEVFNNSTGTIPIPPVSISFDSLFTGFSQVNISQVIPAIGDTPGVYTIEPFTTHIVQYIHLSDIDSAYYKTSRFRLKITNNPWVPLDTIVVRGIDSLSGNLLFKGEFTNLTPGQVQLSTFQSQNKWVHSTIKLRWRFINLAAQSNIYLNPSDVFSMNFWSDSVHLWRGSLSLSTGKISAIYQDTMHLSIPIDLESATVIGGTLSTTGINELPLTVNYGLQWSETGTNINFSLPPQSTQSVDKSVYGVTYNNVDEIYNSLTFAIDGMTQPTSQVYIDTFQTLTSVVSLSSIQLGSVAGELRRNLDIPLPTIKFPIIKDNTVFPSGFLDIPGATMTIKPTINSTFSKSVNLTLKGINSVTGEIAETTMVTEFLDYAVFTNLGSVLKVDPDTIVINGSITLSGTGDLMLSSQIPMEVEFVIPFEVKLTDQILRVHSSRVYLKDPDARKVLKNSQLRNGTLFLFYENSFTVPFDLTVYMRGKKGFLVKKSGSLNPGRTTPTGPTPVIDTLRIPLKRKDLKIFKQFPIDLWFEVKSSNPGVYTLYGNSRLSYSIWVNIKGRLTP